MHYVCVENSVVTSILNYEPSVPPSIKVYPITDGEYNDISAGTKIFDLETRKVQDVAQDVLDQKVVEQENMQKSAFLVSTDWKVMRHIREKALGLNTTLTEQEYIALENRRQNIAKSIVN